MCIDHLRSDLIYHVRDAVEVAEGDLGRPRKRERDIIQRIVRRRTAEALKGEKVCLFTFGNGFENIAEVR